MQACGRSASGNRTKKSLDFKYLIDFTFAFYLRLRLSSTTWSYLMICNFSVSNLTIILLGQPCTYFSTFESQSKITLTLANPNPSANYLAFGATDQNPHGRPGLLPQKVWLLPAGSCSHAEPTADISGSLPLRLESAFSVDDDIESYMKAFDVSFKFS